LLRIKALVRVVTNLVDSCRQKDAGKSIMRGISLDKAGAPQCPRTKKAFVRSPGMAGLTWVSCVGFGALPSVLRKESVHELRLCCKLALPIR